MRTILERRLIVCIFIVSIGFVAVGTKLLKIQFVDRKTLESVGKKQLHKTITIKTSRGKIQDSGRDILAISLKSPSLYADTSKIQNISFASTSVSRILKISELKLNERLSRANRYVLLGRKLNPEQKEKIEKLDIDGLNFEMESKRFYPRRELASSLLGFVGVDNVGLYGLEQSLNRYLEGLTRKILIHRDAKRRRINSNPSRINFPFFSSDKNIISKQTRRGFDVTLTIDANIQYFLEEELSRQFKRAKSKKAIGIMIEVKTGHIIGLASIPRFNPNMYSRSNSESWRESAIQDIYEPGSTFKLITAAAYLEQGGKKKEIFDAEGGKFIVQNTSKILRDHKKFGKISMEDVIVNSSNIGTYKIAKKVGPKLLYQTARRFGFGSRTGLNFPGEAFGILRNPSKWSKLSLASISIGQEIGVTPLQMLMPVAALANEGIMCKPRIVSHIEKFKIHFKKNDSCEGKRVISRKTAKVLTAIMGEVVSRGTGKNAQLKGYKVGGKTGTAQKKKSGEKKYSDLDYVMSFVGFAPLNNPKIALIIIFDEGTLKGGSWGSTVAAPVWKRIVVRTLRYLRIPPDEANVKFINLNLKRTF
ncbi:MAG: penicillin-binding protein 2 [Nitrospinota bacterium]|nr:penicillin-binding protein 2 [Nitrospinota bacterium]